ncbi:hypothetical protein [Flagellimonas onchidii]|uniref:hypothetical protein n=1 Tax=Flagellimonas onchidii TaxID=2562684 RepID=UPI0010A6AA70|nr:hypothetical protein [Allomuricauda onchidii]
MQKNIPFNQLDRLVVQNERVSGISLTVTALQSDGSTKAVIADLQKIGIDITLERSGAKPEIIHNGYLADYLLALYAQTPSYEQWLKDYGSTNKFKIDFDGVLELRGADKLTVEIRAQNTSYTSLSVSHSSISVESIPAAGYQTPICIVDSIGIPSGQTNITESLKDNIIKIVAVTDRSANYFDSTKAKFDGIELTGEGDYIKNVSKELLELENIDYFNNNPESDIEDMVLYAGDMPIHGVTLRGKLTKAAEDDAKIMIVRKVSI